MVVFKRIVGWSFGGSCCSCTRVIGHSSRPTRVSGCLYSFVFPSVLCNPGDGAPLLRSTLGKPEAENPVPATLPFLQEKKATCHHGASKRPPPSMRTTHRVMALADCRAREAAALRGTGRDLPGNETETLPLGSLGQDAPSLCPGCAAPLSPKRARRSQPWPPVRTRRPHYS